MKRKIITEIKDITDNKVRETFHDSLIDGAKVKVFSVEYNCSDCGSKLVLSDFID